MYQYNSSLAHNKLSSNNYNISKMCVMKKIVYENSLTLKELQRSVRTLYVEQVPSTFQKKTF